MQTNYLKHFVDAAAHGSISAAASEDFITPQGMSRSIAVLEDDLGCRLFKRTHNKLTLTSYGEALLPSAREILRIQQDMDRRIAAIRTSELEVSSKEILLYLNNVAFDTTLFHPLTESFEQMFASARYFQCDNETVVDRLLESDENGSTVSVGLLCLFSPDADRNNALVGRLRADGFEYKPYLDSYDQVLVAKTSELATKRSLNSADILSRPIVSSDGDIRRVAEKLFGEKSVYMVTADSSFRHNVVANDTAVAFVPAFSRLTAPEDSDTVAVPMKHPYYLEIGFAGRADVLESPYLKSVLARLNAYYSKYADSPYLSLAAGDLTSYKADGGSEGALERVEPYRLFVEKYRISPRESEVLALLLEGYGAQHIAARLSISNATVKSHTYGVYRKLGVHSQDELMALYEAEGLAADR